MTLLDRLKSKLEYGEGNVLRDEQVPIPCITVGEVREIVQNMEVYEEALRGLRNSKKRLKERRDHLLAENEKLRNLLEQASLSKTEETG